MTDTPLQQAQEKPQADCPPEEPTPTPADPPAEEGGRLPTVGEYFAAFDEGQRDG